MTSKALPSAKNPTPIGLIAALLSIDLFFTYGNLLSAGAVNRFACHALPIAELSTFVMPLKLVQLARTECVTAASLHAISTISFMLKLVVSIFALAPMWGYLLLFEFDFVKQRYFSDSVKSAKGIAYQSTSPIILLGVFLFAIYLIIRLQRTIENFAENAFTALAVDFACFILFVGLVGMTTWVVFTPLTLTKNKRGENSL